ncbi:ubiquitin-like protein Pup [Bifidobacterium criceti]|uniref:Prokaryotic ubiquitin-like protein Pup n=1 Tax=Bifidobacterium criceti TaxID=1960969 RepID=A0A2A2EGL5_9BIFI|nr:ubiquitin-like protein Pup [Bifidobacterium criceti]PAU68203.1 Pup-like protein [Bifidobacterium criceti]
MPQEQRSPSTQHDDTAAAETRHKTTTRADAGIDDLDAILDDIETVLETNAEEYVSGFVQKGGE